MILYLPWERDKSVILQSAKLLVALLALINANVV